MSENAAHICENCKTADLKFACLGDSITSDQVTGIGTRVNTLLATQMIGNFACGWATCADWHDGDGTITPVSLAVPQNTSTSENVLSNQVRRLLQHTAASGAQIAWEHPIGGRFSLPVSVGTGLGYTYRIPDILYIAIGTNDGENSHVTVVDDTDSVFDQAYIQLTRNSIASALRWAIETLQSAYPKAQIFVASPLQADTGANPWMRFKCGRQKRDIIRKVCQFCSVYFIDSFGESGFSALLAHDHGEVHPDAAWKDFIAKFVADRICGNFVCRLG